MFFFSTTVEEKLLNKKSPFILLSKLTDCTIMATDHLTVAKQHYVNIFSTMCMHAVSV